MNEFARFVENNPGLDAYTDEGADAKEQFKRLGWEYFRAMAKGMNLEESKVDFNPGGIAGSGEFHFKGLFAKGQGFDLFFNLNFDGITYRATTALDDYTGDRNRRLPFSALREPDTIVETLRNLH